MQTLPWRSDRTNHTTLQGDTSLLEWSDNVDHVDHVTAQGRHRIQMESDSDINSSWDS